MNQEPKIAVVIPCYNHADILRRTIENIFKQTLLPFEIVVIDDGSDDDPESKINEVEKKITNVNSKNTENLKIKFIKLDKNHGAPYARNLGAKMASAPLILFLDADAELEPNALQEFAEALENHPEADFSYSNFFWGNKRFRGRDFDVKALKHCNYIHTSSLLRRSAFPGFDETLKKFQDWDLWLTMAEKGSKGIWIDKELFRIEPRKQGMSRWLPRVAYWIPWRLIGYQPKEIGRYRKAEEIVRKKHEI
ncbi:MAG: glycosyltransferase family A protein [Patescibacteria group bacterium]